MAVKQETIEKVKGLKIKIHKTTYGSITEFAAHTSMQEFNAVVWSGKKSSVEGSESFTKTKSYNEAEGLMKEGWSEGAKTLTTKLKLANAKPAPSEVVRAVNDIVGFQVNVPRYLQGIPTSMINKKRVPQKQKVVSLVKGITYNGGISAQTILDDSVKFLQLVQAIEKEGIRVNVYAAFYTKSGSEEVFYKFKIKDAKERLNLSKMAFPLMHPSFLRRIIFRAMETDNRITNRGFAIGYGSPGTTQEIRAQLDKNEYYVPILINEKQMLDVLKQATNKKSK